MKRMSRRRAIRGSFAAVVCGVLLAGVSVVPAAHARSMISVGAIHCNGPFQGVRTTSTTKGTATHQVYKPNYQNTSWYNDPGYSANYVNWDYPWYGVYADERYHSYASTGGDVSRAAQYCG